MGGDGRRGGLPLLSQSAGILSMLEILRPILPVDVPRTVCVCLYVCEKGRKIHSIQNVTVMQKD